MTRAIDLTITTLGNQGDGLAPYENDVVSIPHTLPGEVIRTTIAQQKEHIRGTLLEVITPSPQRATPPCPVFGKCGGCRLQHMDDASYRAWKLGAVNHLLEKNDFSVRAETIFVTPPSSRRRASWAAKKEKDGVHIGFHERESHVIIDMPSCHVLKPQLVALLEPLRTIMNNILETGQSLTIHATILNGAIELALSGINFNAQQQQTLISWGAEHKLARLYSQMDENAETSVLLDQTALTGHYGAISVPLPPHAFMQASDEAEHAMLASLKPVFEKAKNAADLFCGTGLFALNLYAKNKTMLAVDVDGNAIRALSAATQNLRGFKTERRNLFRDPLKAIELSHFDTVCLDPPRAGAKEQAAELACSKVAHIAYVSCNPATFMRDARILTQGGYTLTQVHVFDQFLWSHHIELIGMFSR